MGTHVKIDPLNIHECLFMCQMYLFIWMNVLGMMKIIELVFCEMCVCLLHDTHDLNEIRSGVY